MREGQRAGLAAPMVRRTGDILIAVGRFGLLGAIVIGPAAYGLTREDTVTFFNQWMAVTFGAWCLGLCLRARMPRVPIAAWLAITGIIGVGAFTTAAGALDEWLSVTMSNYPPFLEEVAIYGAFDYEAALSAMARTLALLGAFTIATDIFSEKSWTRAVLLAMAGSAIGLVGFYFLQQTVGGPFQLRSHLPGFAPLHFATYRYWGNAASFLNLSWPLLAVCTVHTIALRSMGIATFWLAAFFMVFGAVFFNASKAGHILAPIGILLFCGILLAHAVRNRAFRRLHIPLSIWLGAGIPAVTIVVAAAAAIPFDRWEYLMERGVFEHGRAQAYPYFLSMIPDAGWAGLGPGSFATSYLAYVEDPVVRKIPFWVAHQDYIQTLVEWGYLGTFCWGVLLGWPVVRLLRQSLERTSERDGDAAFLVYQFQDHLKHFWKALPSSNSPILAAGGVTAICVTGLHAGVDFPMQIPSLQLFFLLWVALGWRKVA